MKIFNEIPMTYKQSYSGTDAGNAARRAVAGLSGVEHRRRRVGEGIRSAVNRRPGRDPSREDLLMYAYQRNIGELRLRDDRASAVRRWRIAARVTVPQEPRPADRSTPPSARRPFQRA